MALDEKYGRDGLLGMVCSGVGPALAVIITNPMDVVKTRLQMQSELTRAHGSGESQARAILKTLNQIYSNEGVHGLQRSLKVAMVRDGSKCFFRIGLYEPIVFRIHHDKKNPIPVYKRVVAGAMSGFAGAVICNPLDILKTRIQASGGAAGNHHSYKPTAGFSLLWTIAAREGLIPGLWRGVSANILRSVLFTSAVLPCNSVLKEKSRMRPGLTRDGFCSFVASCIGVFIINPVDVTRTRLYNQPVDEKGRGVLYKGPVDTVIQIGRKEGIPALWKGVGAHFVRAGPHTVLSLVLIGMLQRNTRRLKQWQLGIPIDG